MRNPEQPSVRKVKEWPSWEEGLLDVTRLGHGTGDEVLCGSQSIVDRGRAGESRGELLTHRGAHALELGNGDELHADIGYRLDGRLGRVSRHDRIQGQLGEGSSLLVVGVIVERGAG